MTEPLSRGRRIASWAAQLLVAGILLQTLFFKLTAAPESVYIFSKLGMEPWGRLGSGAAELVAGVLLLIPAFAVWGALLAAGVISGALVSHLTVLGIEVQGDGGLLFGLACAVMAGSLLILWLRRHQLPLLGRRTRTTAALLLAVLLAGPALAVDPVHKTRFGGVAIGGYDPVAYFDQGKAVEGSKEHTFEWRGATWRFATAAHRDQFAKEPERYAPRYGGYCAWAVGHGYTAPGDPQAWSIVDGKLYLNYNTEVKAQWTPDAAGWIAKGDVHWPKLLAGEEPGY